MPGSPHDLRLLFLALFLALSSGVSVRGEGAPPPAPLTDFAGVYAYRNGTTVALVPAGQELVAVLDGGRWQGRQLVSQGWIQRSTEPVTRMGSRQYGYFWWHQSFGVPVAGRTENVDTILASGNGGEKNYIVPSLELGGGVTGGDYNPSEDSPPNAIMESILLPELLAKGPSVPPSASPPASRTAPPAAGTGRG